MKFLVKIITTTIITLFVFNISAQTNEIDSVKYLIQSEKNDSIAAVLNMNLAYIYLSNNLDSCEKYIKISMSKYNTLNDYKGYVNAGFIYAMQKQYTGQIDSAIIIVNKLLAKTIKNSDQWLYARCNHLLGELNRAAEYYDNAILSLNIAINIYDDFQAENLVMQCYNRLAAIYFEKELFSEAIAYSDSSLEISYSINDKDLIVSNLDIKASSLSKQGYINEALNIYNDMLVVAENLDISVYTPNIYKNISSLYFETENYNKSIKYSLLGYNLAVDLDIKHYIEINAKLLSESYAKINDFENAFKYSEIARNVYEEIFNSDKNQQIAELNQKYQTEIQQIEIETQKQLIANNELEIKQKKTINIALYILAFIFILTIIFVLKNRKKIKNKNLLLEDKNEEINQQNIEINQQTENLKKVNQKLKDLYSFKERFSSMLVHDLKNPLNTILNLSNNKQITQASYSMLNIVLNFLDLNKAKSKGLNINKQVYSAQELIDKAYNRTQLLFEQKNIKFTTKYYKDFFINVDYQMTIRIFENLFTNSIKYSSNNSEIIVELAEEKNNLIIKITDFGSGISKANLDKIFTEYTNNYEQSSGKIPSTGLGLTYCKLATEKQNGKIKIESEVNKGTTVSVYFQIDKIEEKQEMEESKTSKNVLELTKNDKKMIFEIVRKIEQYEIYEVSNIVNELKKLDYSNKNMEIWATQIKNAIFSGNKELFYKKISDAK